MTPELQRVLIPDVSYAQDSIGWQELFRQGIVRTGYATTEDKMLVKNIYGSATYNTALGFYHAMYCTSVSEAIREANFCCDLIAKYKPMQTLPVYADYEYFSDEYYLKQKGIAASNRNRTDMIKAFCDTVEQRGHFAGVYLNTDYKDNKVIYSELQKYTLWLAHWGKDSEAPVHQYGLIKINGIDHDINYIDINFIQTVKNFYNRKG